MKSALPPPVFIINLKKDTAKKQHMQKLCATFNLQAEFIEAVDGTLLSDKEIDAVYSKKHAIEIVGRALTKGEIGCALSHKLIYQKIIDENIQTALILEDDVDFDKGLLDCLNKIDAFPKKWELLLLGHYCAHSREIATDFNIWYKKRLLNHIIRRPCERGYGTHGYCLNNRGARKLAKHTSIISLPIDWYTGNEKYINVYIVQNPIIHNNEKLSMMSNLTDDRNKIEKKYIDMNKALESNTPSIPNTPQQTKKLIAIKVLISLFHIIKNFLRTIKCFTIIHKLFWMCVDLIHGIKNFPIKIIDLIPKFGFPRRYK